MSGNASNIVKSITTQGVIPILRSRLLAQLSPFSTPPILILSFPRSGSSWVGKVLAKSTGVAYLREPITQQYIFEHGGRFALVDVNKNSSARSIYQKLSDEAFQGIPPRHSLVVNNWRDFAYPYRKGKRILIKEVNPRAARFYCENYKPKVVLLLRHPAAIALSFYQLGWLESADVQMQTSNPHASPWEKFGYAYGTIMQDAIQALKADGDHQIVVYRHLAEDPYNQFKKLFHALQLELPANYDALIGKYGHSSKSTSKSELDRTSRNIVFRWREELSDLQISELQAGFLQSKMEQYREPAEWIPTDDGAHS